jgi:hypothetical protein
VNREPPQDLTLRLFKSDVAPQAGRAFPALTEATFRGYAPVELDGTDWTITPGAAGEPSTAEHPAHVFESTAQQPEQLVFGYYLTRGAAVMSAVRFPDGPYGMRNRGDTIEVTPVLAQRRVDS